MVVVQHVCQCTQLHIRNIVQGPIVRHANNAKHANNGCSGIPSVKYKSAAKSSHVDMSDLGVIPLSLPIMQYMLQSLLNATCTHLHFNGLPSILRHAFDI